MTRKTAIHGCLKKGFTLIEILIVVSILALVIIAGIFAYQIQLAKGWDARRKSDLSKIKVAVEEYEKDHDCYPPEALLNCSPGTGLRPYITQIPCDPRTKTSYKYEMDTSSCPRWFRLYSFLDNRTDPIMADINCSNNCGPDCAYQYYVASTNTMDTTKCTLPNGTPRPTMSAPPGAYAWGCIDGKCINVAWDVETGTPVCRPFYTSEWACENSVCEPGKTTCISIY